MEWDKKKLSENVKTLRRFRLSKHEIFVLIDFKSIRTKILKKYPLIILLKD